MLLRAGTPRSPCKPYTSCNALTTDKEAQPVDAVEKAIKASSIIDAVGFSNETSVTQAPMPEEAAQQSTSSVNSDGHYQKYSCIPEKRCTMQAECGTGRCVYGKCRCGCVENSPCFMREHCFGYRCVDSCESVIRFPTECNREDQCARGTQCLVGVCKGGGRFNAGMYEGVSCSVFTENTDCAGIGDSKCAILGDLCIRHFDASHIGHVRSGNVCKNGVSASCGFPTCVSAKGAPILCGILDMCKVEGHCGSCKCDRVVDAQ
ncbi:unnamed protein product [Toxocara canis]|uniref:EB domain-containing protein n=1 Tax=Toxocara canis TaxID=6265 RepID=A0A183UPP4_TOXCA|nr:unnamed protein product [Toxocara canis]